jgi:hypothetical protein
MWTIFKEIIASNGASSSTPHTPSRTSMATGARTLASPSVALHALMLAREAESGSLGSQTSPGSAFAKQMTCSPVPDPISIAMPLFGRTRVSTSWIGPQLRAADGENWRASPARLRTSTESGPSLGIVGTWGPEEYFIPILVQNPQAIGLLRHVQCLEERFGFHFHRLQIGTDMRNPIQRSVRVVLFAKTEKLNGE